MSKYLQLVITLLSASFLLSSCEAIGAIFKAGVWSGIILVALIVGLVFFLITRLGGKK